MDAVSYEWWARHRTRFRAPARFAHPTESDDADLTARWQICGIFSAKSWRTRFPPTCSPPRIRREKNLALPQEKLRASSLTQDSQVELKLGTARSGEPALSALHSSGFRIARPRCCWLNRLGNLLKCFNQ
jgi:hypothetical protein